MNKKKNNGVQEYFEVKDWLQGLLQEDEALATFSVDGQYYPGFCIIPDDEAIDYLDLQAALEETLSRIIGADAESDGSDPVFCSFTLDQLIHSVLLADTEEEDDEENALEIDFGYRIHGVITSFNRVPLSAVSFQKKLYERYKFFWMMDNDITIQDAFGDMRDFCKKNPRYEDLPDNQVFEAWEAECGFSGLEYSDFGTFIINEYQTDLRLLQSDYDKNGLGNGPNLSIISYNKPSYLKAYFFMRINNIYYIDKMSNEKYNKY